MSITFGKCPHPGYLDRPITKPNGFGQDNLGKRSVKGVVWHRMIGSLWGTDQYFRLSTTGALTDYGVGVLAQDGADNDGLIMRWNNPLGYQSGWASGTWDANYAYGDGKAFVEKYAKGDPIGVSVINRDQASIEISGLTYAVALSEKSKNAVAAITAYWADQYKIPWDKFPIAPQDGFSFVRWHNEFGPDHGTKKCPGQVVMDATPDMIARTAAIMKQYQEGVVSPPDPAPPGPSIYPEGMDESIAKLLFGSVKGDDGKTYGFDPKGTISGIWLDKGKATGYWPELVSVRHFDNRTYFFFRNWVLWRAGSGAYGELK